MAKLIKKGDIVRRKLKGTKILVGSLKVVDDVCENGIYANDIPLNSLGSMFYRPEDLEVLENITLRIENEELRYVISDNLNWVQHTLNKSWKNALDRYLTSNVKNPIVTVTLVSTKSHIVVTEPVFCKVWDGATTPAKVCVKLKFVRILEQVVR